ncbi:hypothetical protein MKEN_01328400 [Mycena kentingensis (nom. inval.)]|nr:hypothetical protein MKEN_01328400 [Mycena kentingensis (nom. inval.)]
MTSAAQLSLELPTELERSVFETAAAIHPSCMRQLILVARRVKIWIEPMLYKTISIQLAIDPAIPTLQASSLSDTQKVSLQQHVRSVFMAGTSLSDQELLASLLNATRFYFFTPHVLLSDFPDLRPQRLYVELVQLVVPGSPGVSFSQPFMSNVTHLELTDEHTAYNQLTHETFGTSLPTTTWSLAALPRLTHLTGIFPALACREILKACSGLLVMVVPFGGLDVHRSSLSRAYASLVKADPRFFIFTEMYEDERQRDWVHGERCGVDFWVVAEHHAQERKAGTMDPEEFVLKWSEDLYACL